MKTRIFVCVAVIAFLASLGPSVSAQPAPPGAQPVAQPQLEHVAALSVQPELQPRFLMEKPARTVHYQGLFRNRLVVKFKDGPKVRAEEAAIAPGAAGRQAPHLRYKIERATPRDRAIMQKMRLSDDKVHDDLSRVNTMLQRPVVKAWGPLFSRAEEDLTRERTGAEKISGSEHADLGNYFSITLNEDQDASPMADELNALESVEIAYLAPIGEDADIAPPTPSYEANQGYLNAAPGGIDARFAWTQNGGRGQLVRIIDIEQGWNLSHEDLPAPFYRNGVFKTASEQHGTAVLGEMVSRNDGHGVTGIAHSAGYGVVSAVRRRTFLVFSWEEYNLAEAINVAASRLSPGDLILIEQHARGPASGATCSCNCGQFEFVAMEYWQAEYDAIRAATSRGIIVVEAAGNGGMNLDDARYNGRFNRATRDSGAILVGGGSSTTHAPMCWTNFGSRVDVQGWGENVMTAGYGDVRVNGTDNRQWYTRTFSGTSSASPIVTGAAATIQGIRKYAGMEGMRPAELRSLLVQTGTPQSGTNHIGPLPNLQTAIGRLILEDCISFSPANADARLINGQWKVVDGNMWLLHYGADSTGAIKAENTIHHYGMNKQCFIGRPNPSMSYYLVNNAAPTGAYPGEDCIPFAPANLAVRLINGSWKIVDGSMYLLDFADKRNEADAALRRIRQYGFNRICYVRRPNAPMVYFRR